MRLRIILILGVAFLLTACGPSVQAGPDTVVASFYPLAFAAKEIAPSDPVENLTPPGAEPHDLELSPIDAATVREARLVLLLGHGFQPQLEDAAGNGDNVLHLLDTPGLDLLPNGDPHVWLDPLRYAKIVERIGEALGAENAAARLVARLQISTPNTARALRTASAARSSRATRPSPISRSATASSRSRSPGSAQRPSLSRPTSRTSSSSWRSGE